MTYFFLKEKVSKKNFKFALQSLLTTTLPHGNGIRHLIDVRLPTG